MSKECKCSFCGRKGVKLWHPLGEENPLICATCAEKRQSSLTYNEYRWSRNKREAHLTGKKIPLARWIVNDIGEVPSYAGPDADGVPFSYTTTLIIDLEEEKMVPCIPVDEEKFWRSLPTH